MTNLNFDNVNAAPPNEAPDAGEADPYAPFWEKRTVLTHIRDFAKARRVGPWSILGVVLARADAATPPDVRLPPLVGGAASLNMFIALVGSSGDGKGTSEAAGTEAVNFETSTGASINTDSYPVGSGEGLARVYRPHGTEPEAPNVVESAIFTVGEVDTLTALKGRSGSTLMPQLRHIYSGEQLGFSNAGKETNLTVEKHSYRAVLILGVQPLKAGALLEDADGGTPQRVTWMPTGDVYRPEVQPECPAPITVTMPDWPIGQHLMKVPDTAREAVDTHRKAVLRGDAINPLDGHVLQNRLKIAAALAILDSRTHVNGEDWELSATVHEVSANTREVCETAIREKARRANRARAHADAERAEIIDSTRADKAVQRVAKTALRRLTREAGPVAKSELRRAVAGPDRGHFEPALEVLIEQQLVTVTGTERGESVTLINGPEGVETSPPSRNPV